MQKEETLNSLLSVIIYNGREFERGVGQRNGYDIFVLLHHTIYCALLDF